MQPGEMDNKDDNIVEDGNIEKNGLDSTKAKNSKIATTCAVVFAVIAIIGCAFGVYGMFFYPQSSCDTNCTQNVNGDEQQDDNSENLDAQNSAPVTVDDVTKLLEEKYDIVPIGSTFGDRLANHMNDFNENAKIVHVIKKLDDSFGESVYPEDDFSYYIRSISYNDLNSAYAYYFGNENSIEKNDYEFKAMGLIKMTYVPEDDSFDVYYRDGLGGYSFIDQLSKVSSVAGTENGFKAIVLTATINTEIQQDADEAIGKVSYGDGKWYNYMIMSNEDLEETQQSLSAYEFDFVAEDGGYKLISIKKI